MTLLLRIYLFACCLVLFLTTATLAAPRELGTIKSWGYLLQNVRISSIVKSPFELVVIEPQLETDATRMLSRSTVNMMRSLPGKPENRRIIIAYISIGEAEDYRPYWKSSWKKRPPAWLGKENPHWEGNYKVRFWYKEWQEIMLNQIDKILKSGFDGIYLDIVDAWEYWGRVETYNEEWENFQTGDPKGDYREASLRMLHWLELIENRIHSVPPGAREDILLFPQNGEFLLTHLKSQEQERFWKIVDGIGVESVFFYGEKDENNKLNVEKGRLEILKDFLNRGKIVLSVEYLTRSSLVSKYLELAAQHGYVPHTAVRELDRLQLPE